MGDTSRVGFDPGELRALPIADRIAQWMKLAEEASLRAAAAQEAQLAAAKEWLEAAEGIERRLEELRIGVPL